MTNPKGSINSISALVIDGVAIVIGCIFHLANA
jgi:hypothetical protein